MTLYATPTCTVGGLDGIVVGSRPDLHDANGYKPNVLHHILLSRDASKEGSSCDPNLLDYE